MPGRPKLLFTENESNSQRLWGVPNRTPYVKDGINEAVVHRRAEAINPDDVGTKVAAHYIAMIRRRGDRDSPAPSLRDTPTAPTP